jgi:hypothetical protein
VNEAVRTLRVLAREGRGERWSELFLALDSAMSDGGELPDDWRKHRFDGDSDQPATSDSGTSSREPPARLRIST